MRIFYFVDLVLCAIFNESIIAPTYRLPLSSEISALSLEVLLLKLSRIRRIY